MKLSIIGSILLTGMILSACESVAESSTADTKNQRLTAALSGKTLVNAKGNIEVGSDGSLRGRNVEGTWEVRDGKWCRTLTKPERFAGTACQKVQLDGDTVTFVRGDGTTATYTIQ